MSDPDARIQQLERQVASLNRGMAASFQLFQEIVVLIHKHHPIDVAHLEDRLLERRTNALVDESFSSDPEFWRLLRKPVARALGLPEI